MSTMEEMIFHEFSNRSRWDNVSFSEHRTRYDIANYDDDFTQEILAPFKNKASAYKEHLKAYLHILECGDFYPEDLVEDKEAFIQEKLKEFGVDDE